MVPPHRPANRRRNHHLPLAGKRKEKRREERAFRWEGEEERERVSQNERKLGLQPIYTLTQTGPVLLEPTQV